MKDAQWRLLRRQALETILTKRKGALKSGEVLTAVKHGIEVPPLVGILGYHRRVAVMLTKRYAGRRANIRGLPALESEHRYRRPAGRPPLPIASVVHKVSLHKGGIA